MKSILFSIAAAALGLLSTSALAVDASDKVAAQFEHNAASGSKLAKFIPLPVSDKNKPFGDIKPMSEMEGCWQVLNIPVLIGALKTPWLGKGSEAVIPNYVPEMTFHAYVLVKATIVDKSGKPINDKEKECILLDKEVTYVDIPLKRPNNVYIGDKQADAASKINVAVFLSPRDAARLMERDSKEKNDLAPKKNPEIEVLAIAMEASYKGAAVWKKDKQHDTPCLYIGSGMKKHLDGQAQWWKKTGKIGSENTKGVRLYSINETPFASQYYPYYCATKPMYGQAPASSSNSSGLGTTPEADDSNTLTPTGLPTDTTPTADSTPEPMDTGATESTPSSGRKGGKNRRR